MNGIVAGRWQEVTIQHTTAASMIIRIAHPQASSLHRALAKAETRLIELPWSLEGSREAGSVLAILSHSTPGLIHYTDGETCDCETTRGVCWHIAAHRIMLVLTATGANLVAALPMPVTIDEDELAAECFLDGPFDAFEDMELTAPVAAQDDSGTTEQAAPVTLVPVPFRLQPSVVRPNPLDALVDELFAA